jgi:hypothetical protein
MPKEFRSLKSLEAYLKNKIKSAIQDEVPRKVKQTMQENILREVYLKYSPKMYERRGNDGGLMDEENIIYNVLNSNTLEFMNVTKRNLNFNNEYLAPVIEFGHREAQRRGYRGYSYPYPKYAYFYPRPFIKSTREDLYKNKIHVEAFREGLKKFGITTKFKKN